MEKETGVTTAFLIRDNTSLPENASTQNSSTSNNGSDNYYYNFDGFFDWQNDSVLPSLLFIILYDVIALLGVIGNVMILVILRHRSLCSLSYSVYLRFLAVSDLAVVVIRVLEVNLDRFNGIYQRMLTWHLRACQTFMLFFYWTWFLSLWLVVAITCDRMIAVVFPLQWKISSAKKKTFLTCIVITFLTLCFNMSTLYTIDVVPDEFDSTQFYCSFRADVRVIADTLAFVFGSAIPCVLIFLLNMVTLFHIRLSVRQRSKLTGEENIAAARTTIKSFSKRTHYFSSESTQEVTDSTSAELKNVCNANLSGDRPSPEGRIFMSTASAGLSFRNMEEDAQMKDIVHLNEEVNPSDKVTKFPRKNAMTADLKSSTESDNVQNSSDTTASEDKEKTGTENDEAERETKTPSSPSVNRPEANKGGDKDKKCREKPIKQLHETSNISPNPRQENDTVGKETRISSSTIATPKQTHKIEEKVVKFQNPTTKQDKSSNVLSNAQQPKRGNVKKPAKIDRASVSLTYISVSAFLTVSPYGIMHGLFMKFLDEWGAALATNPWTPVPINLQNLVRIWDVLELILLFNFCQNFYILLLTNELVFQAVKDLFGCAKGKKKSAP